MIHISRQALLIEKVSGNYSCPHYIDPKFGKALLDGSGIEGSAEATKLFTEIIENFGIELANSIGSPLTCDSLRSAVQALELAK